MFAQNYPQIDLKVQVNSTRVVAKKIINREVDIAVVGGEISDDLKKNLTIKPFVYDELSLIISPVIIPDITVAIAGTVLKNPSGSHVVTYILPGTIKLSIHAAKFIPGSIVPARFPSNGINIIRIQ